VGSAPLPLPERARPPTRRLTFGAVLVVSAGSTAAAVYGSGSARVLLLILAAAAAAGSAWGSRLRLRSTEETLAAAAVALSVLGADSGSALLEGSPVPPAALAGGYLLLSRLLRRAVTWPLAAWAATQLAALRALDGMPPGAARTTVLVVVALAGLALALAARPLVARAALVTGVAWAASGIVAGCLLAWNGAAGERWLAAGLVVLAAGALLVVRLDPVLDPLLGPPVLVPVISGAAAGLAVGGALSLPGPGAVMLAGYAGVLIASFAAALLDGWPRGLLLPAAVAAGSTLVGLSVAQLVAGARWTELTLLLLLTAASGLLVAALRPEDRPAALPIAVGCLAGAALVAVSADLLSPAAAAGVLSGLYAGTLAAGLRMADDTRRPTVVMGIVCAVVGVVVLAAVRDHGPLAVQLAGQGLLTSAWAWYGWHTAALPPDEEADPAWRAGAAQLVVAAWTGAALAGWDVLEAWTLPLALGLLLAAGPQLLSGPSWPAWGPGLLVAAVPSVLWAVVAPGSTRPVLVLVLAAATTALAAWRGVRAPLMTGAWTTVALGLGLTLVELEAPVAVALGVGAALLAIGARRELRPVAGFRVRLADLR
jgi:hypothetical protein